jgi:hypothetical protein
MLERLQVEVGAEFGVQHRQHVLVEPLMIRSAVVGPCRGNGCPVR